MANNFYQYYSLSLMRRFVVCFSLSFALLLCSKTHAAEYMKLTVYASNVRSIHGYYTYITLGTPSQTVNLALNMTTDLVWFLCGVEPGQTMPPVPSNDIIPTYDFMGSSWCTAYNLNTSTTYLHIFCDSPLCPEDFTHHLDTCDNVTLCAKLDVPLDGYEKLISDSFLSLDNLNMSSEYSDFIFSCYPFQQRISAAYPAQGVLGLGRGDLSFVTQLVLMYDYCFSYCLPLFGRSNDGYLALGKGTNRIPFTFTPLIAREDYPSLYFIKMISVTIDGTQILVNSTKESNTSTVIDVGTLFTSLPPMAYNKMRKVVLALNNNTHIDTAGFYSPLDLCFDTSSGNVPVKTPSVEITFDGNVTFKLYNPDTIIYAVDDTVSCLGFQMQRASDPYNIFGGLQQAETDVLFDLANNKIGFRHNTACTR